MGVTFIDFWLAYPRRKGSPNRAEAEKRFEKAVKNGANAAHIVSSARRFQDEASEQGNIGTPFIPMASTWLNQKRWLDYAPDTGERAAAIDSDMAARGYRWNGERWEKSEGPATH